MTEYIIKGIYSPESTNVWGNFTVNIKTQEILDYKLADTEYSKSYLLKACAKIIDIFEDSQEEFKTLLEKGEFVLAWY